MKSTSSEFILNPKIHISFYCFCIFILLVLNKYSLKVILSSKSVMFLYIILNILKCCLVFLFGEKFCLLVSIYIKLKIDFVLDGHSTRRHNLSISAHYEI